MDSKRLMIIDEPTVYIPTSCIEGMIDIASEKCLKTPSLKHFETILANVTPEMMRGAVNPENVNRDRRYCAYFDIAMVVAGHKPLCIVSHLSVHEWMDKFDLRMIMSGSKRIIWTKDDQYENAKQFAEYLRGKKVCDDYQTAEHHRTLGKYLGYPESDVEFFIQHTIKRHQDAISALSG